jgi:hypothetical protein
MVLAALDANTRPEDDGALSGAAAAREPTRAATEITTQNAANKTEGRPDPECRLEWAADTERSLDFLARMRPVVRIGDISTSALTLELPERGKWRTNHYHFGGPADSRSPVALRHSLTGDLPFRLLSKVNMAVLPPHVNANLRKRARNGAPNQFATETTRFDHTNRRFTHWETNDGGTIQRRSR